MVKATKNVEERISTIISLSRQRVAIAVNQTMVAAYFEIGRIITEEQQKGKARANYGEQLMKGLSATLVKKFGKGFSQRNLEQMRQFYQVYAYRFDSKSQAIELGTAKHPIAQTTSAQSGKNIEGSNLFKLSWSHYLKLMRIAGKDERDFYEIECVNNNWSLRELQRQFDSALFNRLSVSRNKKQVKLLAQKGQIINTPEDAVKDPYVLEFLGLEEKATYSESELEQRLIDKLEDFLLELGTGFTFVARQKRISFDEKHFKIDLVFYNRLLDCFVLFDLKIGELKHQDIGQMQMYVNYFDREIKLESENKTIGVILCQDKTEAIVRYTLPKNNKQIFASKYLTVLPTKEMLQKLLDI